jgi:adenylylsulfate reductase subunit B
MSVKRIDLNLCIGCKECYTVCPMDVFRFDSVAKKSVIAYPENCQSCGQCYLNCPGRSITIVNEMTGYSITSYRATTTARNAKSETTK